MVFDNARLGKRLFRMPNVFHGCAKIRNLAEIARRFCSHETIQDLNGEEHFVNRIVSGRVQALRAVMIPSRFSTF